MGVLGIDRDKANHLFAHCLASYGKFSHREMSRRELLAKMKKLAQFSVDRSFRTHLAELETRIDDVIKKERRILTIAKRERDVGHGLQERIDQLEEKLTRYIEQKALHEVKIKELESKVQKRMNRRQLVHELKNQIAALQEVYDEVSASRYLYDPSRVRKAEQRLNVLKKKLQEIEKANN